MVVSKGQYELISHIIYIKMFFMLYIFYLNAKSAEGNKSNRNKNSVHYKNSLFHLATLAIEEVQSK